VRRVWLSSRNGCFCCLPPAGEPCAPLFDVAGAILGRILGTILALRWYPRSNRGLVIRWTAPHGSILGSFNPLPVMPPLQICRRLKLRAGQRVKDAKFRQRHPVIETVDDVPDEAP
jgi:hypothetical protein